MSEWPTVTAIVVGYDSSAGDMARLLGSLRAQTRPPTQILCVDQSSDRRFAAALDGDSDTEVLVPVSNLGYSSGCNFAARRATGDCLLFINPDAEADPRCIEHLADALASWPGSALAGAQVLLPGGRTVNAGDNVLHLSGLSWAGRYGLPVEDGPPRPAAVVSGAALLVRRDAFEAVGGYTEGFFMYYDDVDLAWRLRLASHEVLFCPAARVTHDYEFSKGSYKWRYLERNRWWCLLAHLELRTLLALAPLLLAVEAAIWRRAIAEGWADAKLSAWRLLWSDRHALAARRTEIQAGRRIGDRQVLERMRAEVDSPFLASTLIRMLQAALRAYRRLVLAVSH
ncbi:MAG: glycosyltransferase family 2 protein [Solirubrobacteraceae bacterium]